MTAPQPGHDGVPTPNCPRGHGPMQPAEDGYWECITCSFRAVSLLSNSEVDAQIRPAAPSEPTVGAALCGGVHDGDGCDCPQPPAEGQQADEREQLAEVLRNVGIAFVDRQTARAYADAVLAARPSADTETLRMVLLALAARWESQVTPRSFHPAGTHTDGRSQALADAAAELRAALDGTP